jgi:rsbT co-antagonist protein RsbR
MQQVMAERSHGDPRAAQIRDLILELLPARLDGDGDGDGAPGALPPGDELGQALALLQAARKRAPARPSPDETPARLGELLEMIVALVSFDYDKRAAVSGKNDLYDQFASGLNMLAEELASSTVSKDYVNNIIESMSDLLVVTDRDAYIKTVNQAACDLVGRSRGELIARPIDELFTELSALDLLKTGGVRDQEQDCEAEGGRRVRVSFSASVLRDRRGEAQGLVCVARDLTEKKRLEEELAPPGGDPAKGYPPRRAVHAAHPDHKRYPGDAPHRHRGRGARSPDHRYLASGRRLPVHRGGDPRYHRDPHHG